MTCGAGARRRLPSIKVQGPRAPAQPRPAGHPGPVAARHCFGGQPPGSWIAGLLHRRAGAGEPGPPGSRTAGLECGREGSASRAAAARPPHTTRLAEQVCGPRSLGARPRLSPAARRRPVLGLPPLAPEYGERIDATFAGFPRAGRDRHGRRPHRFSSTLFLPFPPRLIFHLREEPPPETRRGGGRHPWPLYSLLPDSPLPPGRPFFSLYFSFLSPLPLKPSLVRRREARRGWWASWAESARVFPLSCSRAGGGAGQRPQTAGPARPGRTEPQTESPRPIHPPGATRARLGARALALRWSRCRARESAF